MQPATKLQMLTKGMYRIRYNYFFALLKKNQAKAERMLKAAIVLNKFISRQIDIEEGD